jgi:hypothetical protein
MIVNHVPRMPNGKDFEKQSRLRSGTVGHQAQRMLGDVLGKIDLCR